MTAAHGAVMHDCRSVNDDCTVRAGAASAKNASRADDSLGVIGAARHRDDERTGGDGRDEYHSHGLSSLAFHGLQLAPHSVAKTGLPMTSPASSENMIPISGGKMIANGVGRRSLQVPLGALCDFWATMNWVRLQICKF